MYRFTSITCAANDHVKRYVPNVGVTEVLVIKCIGKSGAMGNYKKCVRVSDSHYDIVSVIRLASNSISP